MLCSSVQKRKLFTVAVLLFFAGATPVIAGPVPGAGIVGFDYSGSAGFALITNYSLFSSDNGISWREVELPGKPASLTSVATGGESVFVGTRSGRVYRSINGSGFKTATDPIDPYNRKVAPLKLLAVGPKGSEVLASSGQGAVVSHDAGASWQPVEPFWKTRAAREVLLVGFAGKTAVVVTSNGPYYRTRNGFTKATKGLPPQVRPVTSAADRGRVILALEGYGIFETKNGKTYKKLARAPDNPIAFLGYTPDGYLASAPFSKLYRGDSKGRKWTDVSPFSPGFVPVVSRAGGPGNFVVFRDKGLYRLKGVDFEYVDLSKPLAEINALADFSDTRIAGTRSGLYLSLDRGVSWKDVTPKGLGSPVTALLKTGDGRVFASSAGSGVFVSVDRGRRWASWNEGLGTANSVRSIIEDSGEILAATENGLMSRGLEAGSLWKEAGRGIGNVTVMDLRATSGRQVAATLSGLYAASPGKSFKLVKGFPGPVTSLSTAKDRILVLADNRVITGRIGRKVKKLATFPKGVQATSVLLYGDRILAGTTSGVYSYVKSGWKKIGGRDEAVRRLFRYQNNIRVVTAGSGTFYIK